MGLPSLKMSRRGFARAAAFAALVLAAGAKAITPGAADELKTVRIFYPPLDFGWTSGYELIEVANAQGYFKKHGLDAQLAVVPWDQYTVALDSGALDFAPFADYAYFINALDKGLKAKEVVSSTLPFIPEAAGEGLIVKGDGPIKNRRGSQGQEDRHAMAKLLRSLVRARLAVETWRDEGRRHDRARSAGAIAAGSRPGRG